jgi:hypothetical protein
MFTTNTPRGCRLAWSRLVDLGSFQWSSFKEYLYSKYAKSYALCIFEHVQKYNHMLNNVNDIMLVKPTIRNNIVNSLVVFSRYTGNYEQFKNELKIHGIKKYKPDPIEAFTRIFNSNAHNGLGKWYNDALNALADNEKLYLRYMLLSGIRAMEGIHSFNILVDLGDKYTQEYFNTQTNFLEHFKYPKLFLRNSKNLYVSAVPKALLDEISKSSKVSYHTITKKIHRADLGMKIKRLRSYYATNMRQAGLLSEQIDLLQGRVGKSIFLAHYFKQDPKALSDKVLTLLSTYEKFLIP